MNRIVAFLQRLVSNKLAALHRLQKRIVKLSRDARAFRQPFIKTDAHDSRNLSEAQAVEQPDYEKSNNGIQHAKPDCLVPGRQNAEIQSCTNLIPHRIVIAGNHSKLISAGAEV